MRLILEQAVSFFTMLVNIYQITGYHVGRSVHHPPSTNDEVKEGAQPHLYLVCSTVKFAEQDVISESTVVLRYSVVFSL